MARCMLCSSQVGDADVTCPLCGGAVEEGDPTVVADRTQVQPVDLGKPGDGPGAPPPGYAPPSGHGPPSAYGPPSRHGPPSASFAPSPFGDGLPFASAGEASPFADRPWFGPPGGYAPPPPGPAASYTPPPGYAVGPAAGLGYGPPPGYGPPGYGPQYGYAGPQYGYGGWPAYVPPIPYDAMAVAAFVTSLAGTVLGLGLFLPAVACPVGAVLGHVALGRIAKTGKRGRGFALAGIIIGWIVTGLLVIGIALIVAAVASTE